jgi:mycofactocin system transcriptional regulator
MAPSAVDKVVEDGGVTATTDRARAGRPPVTSPWELECVALDLFTERGFDATTVEDIAAAAGIGRRTFFRYYPSKNDVVWGDFDAGLARLRARLAAVDDAAPVFAALQAEVLAFNTVHPDEAPRHRERMALILRVPTLQAHSTLRYAAWRDVVASYVGRRLGVRAPDLLPQTVAHATLGACLAGYEQWLRTPGAELVPLLADALSVLGTGLAALARNGDAVPR